MSTLGSPRRWLSPSPHPHPTPPPTPPIRLPTVPLQAFHLVPQQPADDAAIPHPLGCPAPWHGFSWAWAPRSRSRIPETPGLWLPPSDRGQGLKVACGAAPPHPANMSAHTEAHRHCPFLSGQPPLHHSSNSELFSCPVLSDLKAHPAGERPRDFGQLEEQTLGMIAAIFFTRIFFFWDW